MAIKKFNRFIFVLIALILLGGTGAYFYFAEPRPPRIKLLPRTHYLRPGQKLSLRIEDREAGLAKVQVILKSKDSQWQLLSSDFPPGVKEWITEFGLGRKAPDGDCILLIQARDRSWNNLFKGNLAAKQFKIVLDSKIPRIYLQTFRHNLSRGGSGLVAFKVSEPVKKAWVEVAGFVFPAYQQPTGLYYALFSWPYNVSSKDVAPLIKIKDRAGNLGRSSFHYYLKKTRFQHSKIKVSDTFLQAKMVQFQQQFPGTTDLLALFLRVNRELRRQNREQLLGVGKESSPVAMWEGNFVRQPNAARKAGFGTVRTYFYHGRKIDTEIHLGIDLASVAKDKVLAANKGRVVYADWLGIYGNVVIIDHGLGLQTLYAHLSEIFVHPGDLVNKRQVIGRTGATGMAGGDHLHFGVLVSGCPVNPVEWWDRKWIKNNILANMK